VLATWVGIPLALLSSALAVYVARRMTTAVKEPLETFSNLAHRVGKGDFNSPVHVRGPVEIVALAEELERMRRQLGQLEALKQGFLASVSHELRTPLSKIREALALLRDGAVGPLDERQQRVVQIASVACEREIRMVTTLLDLSRLRAGSPLRLRDHCALDSTIQAALRDEGSDAKDRDIQFELQAPGEGPQCRMDPVLVERSLSNLLRNAASVSAAGAHVLVRREVLPRREGYEGAWACVSVSDQGPGVPEEIRSRIFEAFVTEAVAGADRAVGAGIGLALAHEVARAHGGDLLLASSGPQGTTFELWLPLSGVVRSVAGELPRSLGIDPAVG
jgi:two-component system sensor histidine kinase GlrK